jgi:hypothetical protein
MKIAFGRLSLQPISLAAPPRRREKNHLRLSAFAGATIFSAITSLFQSNIGKIQNTPTILNTNPPIVPIASENQKISFCPSIRKGINPKQVDMIVSKIGIAFPATDFKTLRL